MHYLSAFPRPLSLFEDGEKNSLAFNKLCSLNMGSVSCGVTIAATSVPSQAGHCLKLGRFSFGHGRTQQAELI